MTEEVKNTTVAAPGAKKPEDVKEVSQADQAKDSKAEREVGQIPQRKDEVKAPTPDTSKGEAAKESPGKPWADYASEQEELYKKNTGQDIEKNVDGRVKP